MKLKGFIKNNSAVAGVVEAILLIALVAIIISLIQLYYIPVIMEQKEADHMDQVSNQFSQLKSVVEIQSMLGAMGTNEPIVYSHLSSPITLGSKELPYFISARSTGQIDLIDIEDAGNHIIDIQPISIPIFNNGIPLTSLKYRANNFYFPKDTSETWQEYVFEGGGIILKQSDGEVMRVHPGFAVEENSQDNNITIKYFIPLFNGVPGKKMVADYKDCFVHTNYSNHFKHTGNANYFNISSEYADAWYQSLVNESSGILWEYLNNGYINVALNDAVNPNKVEITPASYSIYIECTIVEIGVQVGPGYVVTN